ncbi:Galactose-1-phosphate uridylyltransferase [Anatilimnocola aggregata]|uniref:Galactose-1-phosphate uridylyltransferase n=1 Tax=Anatilimnocola aggregata TaxID=2528021 RepID=A0A517Y9N6_9BACT|nr:galactose-1-phosphate uridylyltransferase [Anatilimnocola aggregata]QDU26938.1 Galactose-1-phosphate uridylyltransferase [Anatilimnocola aggregata]
MPEYRQDPLSQRWVIVGSERSSRPQEFVERTDRPSDLNCPFCAGNEEQTPHAVQIYPATNGRAKTFPWQVRVVPNKYPAVTTEVPASPTSQNGSLHRHEIGFGQHEVIIESPEHITSLSELSLADQVLVWRAYQDRLRTLRQDGRFKYVQIFKNVGAAAGASLEHTHSQVVALPWTPPDVQSEADRFGQHQTKTGRSLLTQIVEEELASGERIVAQSPRFVAFCPWASRFPYQVCLAPRKQAGTIEQLQAGELSELATIVGEVIGRIERALARPSYNLILHTEPFDIGSHDHYHWHIEIFPRLTKAAGFEWSTGCWMNPQPPEQAAALLRESGLSPAS